MPIKQHIKLIQRACKSIREKKYIWVSGDTSAKAKLSVVFCIRHGYLSFEVTLDTLAGGENTVLNQYGLLCCSKYIQSFKQQKNIIERKIKVIGEDSLTLNEKETSKAFKECY